MSKFCSSCQKLNDRKGRYCADCHAAYMRDWRITNRLEGEARKRADARSYANTYKKRGLIEQKPCEVCGNANSQMHHPDHELPRDVVWLCRPCHLSWHEVWRDVARRTFEQWFSRARAPKRVA